MIRQATCTFVAATLCSACYLSHRSEQSDTATHPIDAGDSVDATTDPVATEDGHPEGDEQCVEIDPADPDSGVHLGLSVMRSRPIHLFSPESASSIRLGSHSETFVLQCVNLLEGCSIGHIRATFTPNERWVNYFMARVERCDFCPQDCEPVGSAWTEYELVLYADPLAEGSYEVLYNSSVPAASGFVVDGAASAIREGWSRECELSGQCEPTPPSVSSLAEETTFDADEPIELPLLIEVPFRCPQDGVVTEVAWSMTRGRPPAIPGPIELVFYSLEPEEARCTCPENGCAPLTVQRTLTIMPGLLPPGAHTVEHNGELVETFSIE